MEKDSSVKGKVFYSYSHADEALRVELEKHLSILKRQGKILGWNDRMIDAGSEWGNEIDSNLNSSNVILLLVSSDFIASEYCYGKELQAAINKQKSGEAIVIPIILRACDWQETVLGDLQALPKDGKPVTSWVNKDEAWTNVAQGIRKAINKAKFHKAMEFAKIYEQQDSKLEQKHADNLPEMRGIKESLTRAVERLDYMFTEEQEIFGLATSFDELDDVLGGVESGELIVVSGRTGVGKTSFVSNLVESFSIKQQKTVAFISQEIDEDSVAMRLMTSIARVDRQRMRSAKLEDEDWPRLTSAVGILSEANIILGYGSDFDIESISKKLSNIKEKSDIDAIVIDGVHLIGDAIGGSSQEYSTVSHKLKMLASKMNVPVIVTLPVGFECEERTNKRPLLYDLRKYGDFEQVADIVIFVYRDEMYNEDSPDLGVAELIVAKNRRGKVGTVRLAFLGKYLRFENLLRASESELN